MYDQREHEDVRHDRGNNNSGAKDDESLLEHQSGSDLEAGGLTVYFYNWDALSNGSPYLALDDAIVASQGVGSNDGPCLTMTDEPGWYQIQAYTNGTIATKCTEENADRCEPDDKQWRGLNINSNYVYICECDSEQEAREQLGPPPSEDGGSGGGSETTATPTPDDGGEATATPTPTPESDDPTPTRPNRRAPRRPRAAATAAIAVAATTAARTARAMASRTTSRPTSRATNRTTGTRRP